MKYNQATLEDNAIVSKCTMEALANKWLLSEVC
jgi:hypothetical protein